jgi:phosphoribosyl 1,2-cyclic phosphate phosphodiesterase
MSALELLFLGTGTSAGVPMIGCRCAVCTSSDPRDSRTRSSVVIRYNGGAVLIDSTPEVRIQCVANSVVSIDAVVYTHAHADHIMGMDDLRRFNAVTGLPLEIYADQRTMSALQRTFAYAFQPPDPSLKVSRPHFLSRTIDGPFKILGETWNPIPLVHGDEPVLGFRVGGLAYCTDVSHVPESSYALLEGLEVLVLDALQHRKHPTHLTVSEALGVAERVGAKRTYFTHIAHGLAHGKTCEDLPEGVELAYDGLRVVVPARGVHRSSSLDCPAGTLDTLPTGSNNSSRL